MSRFHRIIYPVFALVLFFSTLTFVSAQDDEEVVVSEKTISVAPMFSAATSGNEDDDDKVTGATLRGRIV